MKNKKYQNNKKQQTNKQKFNPARQTGCPARTSQNDSWASQQTLNSAEAQPGMDCKTEIMKVLVKNMHELFLFYNFRVEKIFLKHETKPKNDR